jgi:Uma2 family endonuclease
VDGSAAEAVLAEKSMAQLAIRMTADDLLKLPMGKGKRYELVAGELREMAPAGYRDGKEAARCARIVGNFVAPRRLGDVLGAETGFLLRRHPDYVRAPDCAFVAAGRLPAGSEPTGYAEIAPDFVVEIVSPGDTASDVQEKIVEWLQSGTKVVWAVYSSLQEVVVWRGPGRAERRRDNEELDAEPAIPGFRCKVSELFAD